LTNPFYRQLRQLFYFHNDGQVYLNRTLANWSRALTLYPYTAALSEFIGPPIPRKDMSSPDTVLQPDDIHHPEITRERLDKAAATQLVFEDVLFHIVGHLIRSTGSHKLVMTGGTALNAVANMRLLDHFDEEFYERYLGLKNTRLHLWVPPTPSDSGVTAGAAFNFALTHGASLGEPLRHAFYCGAASPHGEIAEALQATAEIRWIVVGNTSEPERRDAVADLLAYIVSHDGVMGIFQGSAETGPRALGHRSILANPCNPRTRDVLNQLVKHRETVRPLAPMATYAAARRWFELSPGASDDDYNAYNYMVLTARARVDAYLAIPAVIHKDGTSRVQIVRPETDPFTYAYLKAMGRRAGVEVSVNTSLNVGSPIAQTPKQALETLKRSKGMDGLIFISAEGHTFLAWHDVEAPPKDPGRLRRWLSSWQEETSTHLVKKNS
jgi:carbamoyltransferase